jgi:GntR family transcriptional regulator/MocR family aminotransferase
LTARISLLAAPGEESVPLHVRLYRQLRQHVLSGSLAPGDRLPSARMFARDLGISRNTVEAAFAQLVEEGFVERRVGAGSVITRSLAEVAPFLPVSTAARKSSRTVRLGPRGARLAELGRVEVEADLAPGACSTNAPGFPWQAWNRLLAREARRGGVALLSSAPHQGIPELRREIASYARLTRGLRCSEEQVLVMNSTQQAIDLAARLLLEPGDTALIEEPCYRSARAALLAAEARVHGLPVDDEGLIAEALEQAPRGKLLYVTPSHQFPLGMTMSLPRRLALLRWAERRRAWIFEDDYDSEFCHDGRPIAALQALDTAHRVIYAGTFNKVLFPGLRLAYLIVPEALVEAFTAARRLVDGYSPPLPQAVLAEFMASGRFASYLRQARQHFAACRDALVDSVQRTWGGAVRLGPSSTGLHVVAHLPRDCDDRKLAAGAPPGLGLAALSAYYFGRHFGRQKPRGLLLSYGTATPAEIRVAVEGLGPLLRSGTKKTR